jgi:hypothetical protein
MSAGESARRRIEAAHRYGAAYRGGLASHYPMTIAALDAMGATDADLDRFEARYLPQLEPMPKAVVTIEPGDEAAHLGSPRAFPEWVLYFDSAIAREGPETILRTWLDRLTPAVAAAAFHGAIRTAFAVESGAEGELSHALAYWASAYRTLPQAPEPSGRRSPHEVLAAIAADPERAGKRMPGNGIISRAVAASRLPTFDGYLASLDPEQLALDSIARAALNAYAASGDFALLHCVTGVHAFRVLGPYASDSGASLLDLWSAVVATYIGTGAPPVAGWRLKGNDSLEWPAIHRRAVKREDEHDIKLVYSCWREWQHRGDDLYRRAASVRVA